jgi:hypothetical protein
VLFLAQAAAAAKVDATPSRHTIRQLPATVSLATRLERTLVVARKARSVVRFFETHRALLRSKEHGAVARKTFVRARIRLARATKQLTRLSRALRRHRVQTLRAASPKQAICQVFRRYCHDAVDVAWCESRLRPTAQNGEYLGLFQMGYMERRLFGHGPSPHAQALAAHKYFVYSGRDWSPWTCKPTGA